MSKKTQKKTPQKTKKPRVELTNQRIQLSLTKTQMTKVKALARAELPKTKKLGAATMARQLIQEALDVRRV